MVEINLCTAISDAQIKRGDRAHKYRRELRWRATDAGQRLHARKAREYYKTPTGKRVDRNTKLKRKFGISLARYEEMAQQQANLCAICKKPETAKEGRSGKTRVLAVDHDHTTGAVRDLLCGNCNRGLGYFSESAETLQAAIAYLARHRR